MLPCQALHGSRPAQSKAQHALVAAGAQDVDRAEAVQAGVVVHMRDELRQVGSVALHRHPACARQQSPCCSYHDLPMGILMPKSLPATAFCPAGDAHTPAATPGMRVTLSLLHLHYTFVDAMAFQARISDTCIQSKKASWHLREMPVGRPGKARGRPACAGRSCAHPARRA